MQRLTALALLVLAPWLLVSLLLLPDLQYATLRVWAGGIVNAALLALLVAAACWHSQLGVQEVVVDYVRGWQRTASLILSASVHVVLGVLGVIAIARLALGAGP
jgi:succinate dehydrogenase / fumarate reductase membrane anchor subunit